MFNKQVNLFLLIFLQYLTWFSYFFLVNLQWIINETLKKSACMRLCFRHERLINIIITTKSSGYEENSCETVIKKDKTGEWKRRWGKNKRKLKPRPLTLPSSLMCMCNIAGVWSSLAHIYFSLCLLRRSRLVALGDVVAVRVFPILIVFIG